MTAIHNASAALLQYLDSLLLDEAAQSDEDMPSVGNVQRAEEGGQALSGVAADANTLRLLLFKVGEIPLAISREVIAEIVEVERTSLESFTSKDGMHIRQFNNNGQDVGILDARDIILPEGHPARRAHENDGHVYILMFKGAGCGLMCDHVGEVVDLGYRDVEWRLQRSSRLWLAGMVKANKHALLDEKEIMHIADGVLTS